MVLRDHVDRSTPVPSERLSPTVAEMVEDIVGCKWSLRILQLVGDGGTRPSAIIRHCPGLSVKVMNERLRKLTRFGIVSRTVHGDRPPIQVEYKLTAFGRRFAGVLKSIRELQERVDREGDA